MPKKLFLSFIILTIIFLQFALPVFADGTFVKSPDNIHSSQNTYSNSNSPSDFFKLQRIDSERILCDDPSVEKESLEESIIYSPDLPDSLDPDSYCDEANPLLALELEMIKMVNDARLAAGESELKYSEELAYFARQHSKDMADNHYFSHNSPSSGSYVTRLYASGINYISSGENLARFSCLEDAHAALLRSFGHKKNMLSNKYTHVGIGIVWDEKLEVYCITQWFAKFY